MKKDKVLMVFAKKPVVGNVKTQLAKNIGAQEACTVYTRLLNHMMQTASRCLCDKWLYWDSFDGQMSFLTVGDFEEFEQQGKDPGESMGNAFKSAHRQYEKAILIGTDCPFIHTGLIEDAFEKLSDYDCVIGPAMDGGYYLIGLKKERLTLFQDIAWGEGTAFPQTRQKMEHAGISFYVLPLLRDINTEEDISFLRKNFEDS